MARNSSIPLDRLASSSKTAELDRPLHSLGFVYTHFSPEKVTGLLSVTEPWCQKPFKQMHGGVAAFVAEGVASAGAYFASGFQRVAGVQLSVSHIKPAFIGDQIEVEATRILFSKTIQVWEVQGWRTSPVSGEKELLSTARVTLLCDLPSSKEMKHYEVVLKKSAKL